MNERWILSLHHSCANWCPFWSIGKLWMDFTMKLSCSESCKLTVFWVMFLTAYWTWVFPANCHWGRQALVSTALQALIKTTQCCDTTDSGVNRSKQADVSSADPVCVVPTSFSFNRWHLPLMYLIQYLVNNLRFKTLWQLHIPLFFFPTSITTKKACHVVGSVLSFVLLPSTDVWGWQAWAEGE